MTTLASTLKNEIRRLARKEIKAEIATTKKTTARHRREIASLKRELHEQTRKVAFLERRLETTGTRDAERSESTARFSPGWVRAHRARLALSAADYAALVGVSALTIYNWEQGKTRPGPPQLEAWSTVRRLGKREAWRRLEEME